MNSELAVDISQFANIPAKALNISSRLRLSWFLNPEQPLPSTTHGIARDYRGLAELMGFEYNDIKNFQRSGDPTSKILEAWEARFKATIADLVNFLQTMGRHDIIEELSDQFENDAKAYLRRNQTKIENPVQVAEVTSNLNVECHFKEDPDYLTVSDIQTGKITMFDAYVCYTEEDMDFVIRLAHYLESPELGFRLFIKDRDLLLGTSEIESHVKLIHDRCHRMIIILSPDFLKSPACEFQASFAAGLAIEQQQRKLIPIIISDCQVPLILRLVSKIDFTKPDFEPWVMKRLIESIRGTHTNSFVFTAQKKMQLELNNSNTSNSIFYPSTLNQPYLLPSNTLPLPCSSELPSTSICQAVSVSNATVNNCKTTPPPKNNWYKNFKGRFTSRNTSASSATSGFHSKSDNTFESLDLSTDSCCSTTPL